MYPKYNQNPSNVMAHLPIISSPKRWPLFIFLVIFVLVFQLLTSSSCNGQGKVDRLDARENVDAQQPLIEILQKASHKTSQGTQENHERNARDVLWNYKKTDACSVSSLDLHHAHDPLCSNRRDLLRAMSWGGRAGGFDMPYR